MLTREATQERGDRDGTLISEGQVDLGEREGCNAEVSACSEQLACWKGKQERESATELSSPLM